MLSFFFLRFYLFIHRDAEREREAETQGKGEAVSMQRARRGTRSRDSRIMPWAAGGAKPLRHRGCPLLSFRIECVTFLVEGDRGTKAQDKRKEVIIKV